jgi:hypothetical protein
VSIVDSATTDRDVVEFRFNVWSAEEVSEGGSSPADAAVVEFQSSVIDD